MALAESPPTRLGVGSGSPSGTTPVWRARQAGREKSLLSPDAGESRPVFQSLFLLKGTEHRGSGTRFPYPFGNPAVVADWYCRCRPVALRLPLSRGLPLSFGSRPLLAGRREGAIEFYVLAILANSDETSLHPQESRRNFSGEPIPRPWPWSELPNETHAATTGARSAFHLSGTPRALKSAATCCSPRLWSLVLVGMPVSASHPRTA